MSELPSSPPSRLLPIANVLTAQINTAIITLGSFLVTPRILHALGDSAYGGWLLVASVMAYIRMLDLGISTGAIKFGAGAEGRGSDQDLARVFNTASALFILVGTAALALTLVMTVVLPRIYPVVLTGHVSTIFLLGAAVSVDLGFRTYGAALRARSLFFVPELVEIVSYSVFKLGLVLYFASTGLSYEILASLVLFEAVARNFVVIIVARRASPFTRHMRPLRADLPMLKMMGALSGAVVILRVAEIVRTQIDTAVIGFMMPGTPEAMSIFGIGARLPSIAALTIGVIASTTMPRFSALSERLDERGAVALLGKTSLVTSLATGFLLVNIVVFGPGFLDLWLGRPWVVQSGLILRMLAAGYVFSLIAGPAESLLVGRGKLRGLAAFTVIEALANFALSIALIPVLGIYGVALGTVIPMVIARAIAFPWFIHQALGIRPMAYLRMNARGLAVGLAYLALIAGLAWVPLTSYGRFIALGLLSTIVFALLLLVFVAEARVAARSIMSRVRSYVQRRLGRGDASP